MKLSRNKTRIITETISVTATTLGTKLMFILIIAHFLSNQAYKIKPLVTRTID
jgi:hypothetical protein